MFMLPRNSKNIGNYFFGFYFNYFFSQKFGAFFKQIQLLEALIKKTHIKNHQLFGISGPILLLL